MVKNKKTAAVLLAMAIACQNEFPSYASEGISDTLPQAVNVSAEMPFTGGDIIADGMDAVAEINDYVSDTYMEIADNETESVANPYGYGSGELQLMYAVVMQEGGADYESTLAVITCACNRSQSPKWMHFGNDPLSQLKADGQFCYSIDRHWEKYLNDNVPQTVRDAVADALNGKRNHNFLCFRGYKVAKGTNIGGNYYFSSMM